MTLFRLKCLGMLGFLVLGFSGFGFKVQGSRVIGCRRGLEAS